MENQTEEGKVFELVICVMASSEDVLLNRVRRIEDETYFSTHGLSSWEKDDDGGMYKVIMTAIDRYPDSGVVKQDFNKLRKRNWALCHDAAILLNGTEIYCDGKWYNTQTSQTK